MVTPDAGEIANAAMPSDGLSETQDLLQAPQPRGGVGGKVLGLGAHS